MADATIIVGKLDDKEITNSINNLVSLVERQTKAMVNSFDTAISSINTKLKSIGGVDTNTTNNAAAKRTADIKKEKQAVKETENSYDQLAMAMRQAEIHANKRYSVNDEMINLRTNLHGVEYQLKLIDNQWAAIRPAARGTNDEYNRSLKELQANLEKTREKIKAALGPENAEKRSYLLDQVKAYKEAIDKLQQDRARFLKNLATENTLKGQYDEIQKRIREIANGYINAEANERALVSTSKKYTDEIIRQAQALRESAQFKENGFAYVRKASGMDAVVKSEDYQRQNGVKNVISLEEQLLRIRKENTAE